MAPGEPAGQWPQLGRCAVPALPVGSGWFWEPSTAKAPAGRHGWTLRDQRGHPHAYAYPVDEPNPDAGPLWEAVFTDTPDRPIRGFTSAEAAIVEVERRRPCAYCGRERLPLSGYCVRHFEGRWAVDDTVTVADPTTGEPVQGKILAVHRDRQDGRFYDVLTGPTALHRYPHADVSPAVVEPR